MASGHLYPWYHFEQGPRTNGNLYLPFAHGESLNILPNSSSAEALERARAWLEHCEATDETCRQSSVGSFMPRRLLDVYSLASSGAVLLVEGVSAAKYVCLSYCWGTNLEGVLTTTRSNLQGHCSEGIPYVALPRTIRDAVTVCYGLGIPLLWVDSLCIVQDDPADWAHEAPRMSEIYGRSHLTIYANGSDSCKDGFLGPQKYGDPSWQGTARTPLPPEFLMPANTALVRLSKPVVSRIAPGIETDGAGGPVSDQRMAQSQLDSRGWCLQEELLPNRRLYFDGNEMTWVCCVRSVCECGHMNEHKRTTRDRTLTELKVILGMATSQTTYYTPDDVTRTWKWILEDYTARFVTNSADKLVAVSGLASMMLKALEVLDTGGREAYSQEYCAGLWRRNLLLGLSWTTVPDACTLGRWQPPSRSAKYRAPTWSWASNDAPVEYVSQRVLTQWKYKPTLISTRVRIDEVCCEPVSMGEITGRIKAGHACLTGPIVPVELVRLDEELSERQRDPFSANYNKFGTTNRVFSTGDSVPHRPFQAALVRGKNLLSYSVSLDIAGVGPVLSHTDKTAQCWTERACAQGCCGEKRKTRSKLASVFRKTPLREPEKLVCLELFTWEDHGTQPRTVYINDYYAAMPPETWFLLLREVGDGTYERVGAGYCEARADRDKEVLWPKIQNRPTDTWSMYECALFQDSEFRTVKII